MDPRTSPGDSCEPSHKGQINGTTILQMENQENEISYDGPCHCQLLVEGPNQEVSALLLFMNKVERTLLLGVRCHMQREHKAFLVYRLDLDWE